MGSISKDFKILQEAYSKKIIGEAGGTATGTAKTQTALDAAKALAEQPVNPNDPYGPQRQALNQRKYQELLQANQTAAAVPAAAVPAASPVTSAGVPAAGGEGLGASAVVPATPAQSTKDQADFDTAVTKYFKSQGVSDADIKKFLDSTHTTLKSVAAANAPAAPAGATKPWQPGFTQQNATPQAAPAAAPSTARYMPQSNAAAYGAPGFAGRPSYASR
jgi:hypothetical protein